MENIIIQGILFANADEIKPRDVDLAKIQPEKIFLEKSLQQPSYKNAKEQTLKRFNAGYIGNLLADNNGNVTQAAQSCGLERQALQQIMRRYGIKADKFRKK
jgi:DNA-binding NtrC family response regulator